MNEVRPLRLFNIYGENRGTGFAGNVWDVEGIAPCITTSQGGGIARSVKCDDSLATMVIDEDRQDYLLEQQGGGGGTTEPTR